LFSYTKLEFKYDIIKSMMILNVFDDLQASPVQLSVITKPIYDHNSFVMDSCHQKI